MTGQLTKPRLGFIGSMLGCNPGWVVSQGEILARLFRGDGYAVRLTSTIPNRLGRLVDTVVSVASWRKKVDVVIHSVFSGPAFRIAEISSRIAQMRGLPQVFVLRGGRLPEFARHKESRVRRVFDRAAAIVSPSGYLASVFLGWGYPVVIIPNVLAIEDYPYLARSCVQPRLLWMRTFSKAYYPEMAVLVLKEVLATCPAATLTMGGQEGESLGPTKALAEKEGVSDRIRFAGFFDMAAKQREFPAHDVYLNTNRVDNMPVSLLEAAAFGMPVVATKVGGIPYLVEHEKTALLVENEDADEMAEAVCRLCRDPELARKLSTNGRLLAESCAWPTVRARWDHLFARILGETSPRAVL